MEFSYEIQSGPTYYDENYDEEYCDTETIYYEPDYDELENAVIDVIFENYFKKVVIDKKTFKEKLKELITDLDLQEIKDYFEDDLKEYFRENATERAWNN